MDSQEQKRLIKRCLSGKRDAQKELYERYSQSLFKVCCMYAPDDDSANDFLQEGFLKIFQNLHKYKPTGSLGGWMRRVMVNSCIDAIRRDHWTKLTVSFDENVREQTIEMDESQFEKDLNSSSFFDLIKELPIGYRTILNLYYLEEYTHADISEKLGIAVGTSKSQLSKAKRYLRELLLRSLTMEEIELYVGRLVKQVV